MRAMTRWRSGAFLALALAACADGGGAGDRIRSDAGATLPAADYLTPYEHFAQLQQAALSADYAGFATHIGADDPGATTAKLEDAFGGDPFDVYSLAVEAGSARHRRVAELRGPTGRLYLAYELDRVDGGWTVGDARLGRDRAAALDGLRARMDAAIE